MASYENHNKDDGDVDMTRKGLDSDDDEEEMEEEEEDDQHATVEGTEGYGMFRAPESKYSVDRERQELHKAPTQEAETLLSYIDELLDKQRRNLYGDSWAAQTILQALPPLCQQVTMRLLLIDDPVHISFLLRWAKSMAKAEQQLRDAIERVRCQYMERESIQFCEVYMMQLTQLHILVRSGNENPLDAYDFRGNPVSKTSDAYYLSPEFRNSVKEVLCRAHATPWQKEQNELLQDLGKFDVPSVHWIEQEAAKRWHNVMEFLLGESTQSPPPDIIKLLVSTGLLASGKQFQGKKADQKPDKYAFSSYEDYLKQRNKEIKTIISGGSFYITHKGYRFLLEDVGVQLWTFISEYVRTSNSRGIAADQVLAFLFRLGYCKIGLPYPTKLLAAIERILLKDLSSLGMTFIQDVDGREVFYVTSLAVALTHPSDKSSDGDSYEDQYVDSSLNEIRVGGDLAKGGFKAVIKEEQGRNTRRETGARTVSGVMEALKRMPSAIKMELIVEKNFKIFAYTRKQLHISLLSLFAKIDALLPNVVVAKLTRKNVGHALDMGITADQIIHFLRRRVHHEMTKNKLSIPDNVEDQLHIWERERTRMKFKEATLLGSFANKSQFNAVGSYCQGIGVLLRMNKEKQLLAIEPSSVEDVVDFMNGQTDTNAMENDVEHLLVEDDANEDDHSDSSSYEGV